MANAKAGSILTEHKGGRPVGYSHSDAKRLADGDTDAPASPVTKLAMRKAEALTRKEEALASQAELKFQIDSGEYLSRTAYREASATLLAAVAQALRSLPDLLERKCSLSPEAAERAEKTIDEVLSDLSAGLEMFTEQQ